MTKLRDLIDGLDGVRVALQNEASVVQYGPEHFAQFTPAEAYEMADLVIKAADFLRELEGIVREEPAPFAFGETERTAEREIAAKEPKP